MCPATAGGRSGGKACPVCSNEPIGIPGDMRVFLKEHMDETREGALVITRARMKS